MFSSRLVFGFAEGKGNDLHISMRKELTWIGWDDDLERKVKLLPKQRSKYQFLANVGLNRRFCYSSF